MLPCGVKSLARQFVWLKNMGREDAGSSPAKTSNAWVPRTGSQVSLVAQRIRAPTQVAGVKSCQGIHLFRFVSSVGRATLLHGGGRGFKSLTNHVIHLSIWGVRLFSLVGRAPA